MGQVCGKIKEEILILDSGNKAKRLVTVYLLKFKEVGIKAILLILSKVGKEDNYFKMVMFIKDSIVKENLMELENIIGKTVAITKEILIMEWETDMEFGKKILEKVIDMKDNLKIIKNRVTEYIIGHVDIYIKETIKIICEVDMARCFGKMEVFIKETGKLIFKMAKDNYLMELKN